MTSPSGNTHVKNHPLDALCKSACEDILLFHPNTGNSDLSAFLPDLHMNIVVFSAYQ